MAEEAKKPNGTDAESAEDEMLKKAEETITEMRGAMNSMMSSSMKMMQSFLDMRLAYLKVMRAGLEDPATALEIMRKNMDDTAKALREQQRKDDAPK